MPPPRVHEGRTAGHLLHVLYQLPGPNALEDVPGGAGHHAGVERLVVGVARQHQADQFGQHGAHVPAHLDPAAILQADIEDRHIRMGQRNPHVRLGDRGRLADHLDLLVGLEELAYSFPDQFVVIEQEHPDTHGTILPVPGLAKPDAGCRAIRPAR